MIDIGGDSGEEDRYVDRRPADDGGWLLHGHVHERWRWHRRMINVGVDVWDYRPVAEAALALPGCAPEPEQAPALVEGEMLQVGDAARALLGSPELGLQPRRHFDAIDR